MKMRRVFLFTLITFSVIVITVTSAQSPVDEADEKEEDEVARPIRATPRKRGRPRNRSGNGDSRGVQKRTNRVSAQTFRPTRAPLFEASPPDPYLDSHAGSDGNYGHSHSPPSADPYYSPSKYAREKKRQRNKLTSPAPVLRNSFDVSNEYQPDTTYKEPGKNYAFAYAVGEDAEDFSHKEARDGQVTIGEYRITLPDGRTQVVRYTAGGKTGYKADVTYEKAIQEIPSKSRAPSGPSPTLGGYRNHPSLNSGLHKQYHQSIQPAHFAAATPSTAPSFNSNRVYKSKPLKTTPLYGEDDDDDDELSYQRHQSGGGGGAPRLNFKAGNIPRAPTPTPIFNSVSTTATPRPNSIYDKISPYRGGAGKYINNENLAYAHEQSPRAGPARARAANSLAPALPPPPKVRTTAATYYESPKVRGRQSVKSTALPTKKYKDPAYYSQQPQANHPNEYVRPAKHFQYLQETPVHSHSQAVVAKPIKDSGSHVVPLDLYKSGPIRGTYPYTLIKPKKNKKKHGIHQPHGQYLFQTPVTEQTPSLYQPTSPGLIPKEPFHYYNSFHEPHHHGFGQISASPTPTIATNSLINNDSPYPSPYPATAYPSPTKPYMTEHVTPPQPRVRLPVPPSTSGHVYLETPALGARPNNMGVKELLSRLPNIPAPKTTVHPYEVGSADYGKSVAYGNTQQDKGYPEHEQRQQFHFEGGNDHLDPTSSLFSAVGGDEQFNFPNEQFNFLDGFNNFDIEQANVREIRQPQQRLRRQRRPDKRKGVPAPSSSSSPPEFDSQSSPQQEARSPPPRRRQPTTPRGKPKRRRMRTQQPDPMMHAVESRRTRPRNQTKTSRN